MCGNDGDIDHKYQQQQQQRFSHVMFSGFIADIEGSYAPAFYMAGAMELTAAGIASLAFCFPSNKDKVNDEVKTSELELLTVTERETVL